MKFNGRTLPGVTPGDAANPATDRSTRDEVARMVLERGPQCAADLAAGLGLSPAGVRRHLDALVAEGVLELCAPRRAATASGPGRPARAYQLTDAGRGSFPHAYDDLATTALRYLDATGGADAVRRFAEHRAGQLAATVAPALREVEPDSAHQAEALAGALSGQGYAATVQSTPAGVQLCQRHCPVAHVAAQFPQLCEAETRAFEQLLGTNVQRLATIAHGDGVCTTHFADRSRLAPAGADLPNSASSPLTPARTPASSTAAPDSRSAQRRNS